MTLTDIPCFVVEDKNVVFKPVDHAKFLNETVNGIEDEIPFGNTGANGPLQPLYMVGGKLAVLAYIAKAMAIDAKLLVSIVDGDNLESLLKAIVFFYSKPGSDATCQLTTTDAYCLLQLMACGAGMKEWVEGVTLTGTFVTPLGEIIGKTTPKCDLVRVVKDGRFWKRPEMLQKLSKQINAVHAKLLVINAPFYEAAAMQHDAYHARFMATSAIVDEVAAYATFLAAKTAKRGAMSIYVGLTTLYADLCVDEVLRDANFAMSDLQKQDGKPTIPIRFAILPHTAPERYESIAAVQASNPLKRKLEAK